MTNHLWLALGISSVLTIRLLWRVLKTTPPGSTPSRRRRVLLALGNTAAALLLLTIFLAASDNGLRPKVTPTDTDPIEFARSTYIRLSHGDPAVEDAIDFENLSGGGMPVGATYSLLPDEARKATFRREFIANYAKMFRQTGASVESLTNWRLDSADATQETVAADVPGGDTALVILSKRGDSLKVIGFNMR